MAIDQAADKPDEIIDMLRESARQYCARALDPARLRQLRASGADFDRARWREMAELGWASIPVPTDLGGLALGVAGVAAVCEQLGAVAAPEPLLETAGAVAVLAAIDTPGDLLARVVAGDAIVSLPAPIHGRDPFQAVTASIDGAGYRLSGTVSHLPAARAADAFLVPATIDGRPAIFHVPANAPGTELTFRRLADGSGDGCLALSGHRCEAADRLGVGDATAHAIEHAAALGGLASSAYLLGLAEALLRITIDYVRQRQQFGQPIGSFQVIQHRLVDLYIHVRVTAAVVRDCSEDFEAKTGAARDDVVSRARYRACETALTVVRQAVQLHGGIGYTDECAVGLYLNRALVLLARFGNASTHLGRLAKRSVAVATQRTAHAPAGAIEANATPPAGDWNALENEEFRQIVRAWLQANYPEHLRHPPARVRWAEIKDWHRQLVDRGWAAPAWPVAHGGMGLAPDKLLIFIEERERWGVARAPDQGILMVGPMLMAHGSEAQRAYYLPKALSGEHIWCQGYSEPNAGSDLASLRTTAERDGDHFIVNGQKIWTTLAQDATHMFCLVRTDKQAKPQAGISFLLIDLAVPGITIRPIRTIAGHEEFCEVFFDNVRVPAANLVGRLNEGWTIAKSLLGFERIFVGSPRTCQYAIQRLQELGAALGLTEDGAFRDRLARLGQDVIDLESIYKEFADVVRRGEPLGADVSILKIWASETYARISEALLEAAGAEGAATGPLDFAGTTIDVLSHYYNARPTTIYGGTNEIQRNIIAKQVLDLPMR